MNAPATHGVALHLASACSGGFDYGFGYSWVGTTVRWYALPVLVEMWAQRLELSAWNKVGHVLHRLSLAPLLETVASPESV